MKTKLRIDEFDYSNLGIKQMKVNREGWGVKPIIAEKTVIDGEQYELLNKESVQDFTDYVEKRGYANCAESVMGNARIKPSVQSKRKDIHRRLIAHIKAEIKSRNFKKDLPIKWGDHDGWDDSFDLNNSRGMPLEDEMKEAFEKNPTPPKKKAVVKCDFSFGDFLKKMNVNRYGFHYGCNRNIAKNHDKPVLAYVTTTLKREAVAIVKLTKKIVGIHMCIENGWRADQISLFDAQEKIDKIINAKPLFKEATGEEAEELKRQLEIETQQKIMEAL